jgi:hypothetical protein
LREELTSVAHGESEGILSFVEELGELLASSVVKEDRFGPSVSGSENVSVRESTTRRYSLEVVERSLARDEVRHVNVDRGETCLSERPRHLDVTVDTLFSKNGDLGTVVERSEAFEDRIGDVDRRVERESVEETGVVFASDVLVLLESAGGTVPERLHLVRGFSPLLLELSAS